MRLFKIASIVAIALSCMLISGCAGGVSLRTYSATPAELTGTYTVFLYGGNYLLDLRTAAFLDKEGDAYAFEMYAPDFDYKVIKHVPAREAIELAARHVSKHPSFRYYRISGILDPAGYVVGYEVRPYYDPFEFGFSDVLLIDYWIKDSKIITSVHLHPDVEKLLQGESPHRRRIF